MKLHINYVTGELGWRRKRRLKIVKREIISTNMKLREPSTPGSERAENFLDGCYSPYVSSWPFSLYGMSDYWTGSRSPAIPVLRVGPQRQKGAVDVTCPPAERLCHGPCKKKWVSSGLERFAPVAWWVVTGLAATTLGLSFEWYSTWYWVGCRNGLDNPNSGWSAISVCQYLLFYPMD